MSPSPLNCDSDHSFYRFSSRKIYKPHTERLRELGVPWLKIFMASDISILFLAVILHCNLFD